MQSDAVILSPVELAFLGAAAISPEQVPIVLLQQLGVPEGWVDNEAFQACGLQVLTARRLASVEPGHVVLEPVVAEVAAALTAPQVIAVLISQGADGSISGVRIVDSATGRVALTPESPGCWRAASLDRAQPLDALVGAAVLGVLNGEGGTVIVSEATGASPADEHTMVLRSGSTGEEVAEALSHFFPR